jgi:hypothetical protein
MGWFERHLNWTLVFSLIGLPIIISLILRALHSTESILGMIVELVLLIFCLIVTWWYLSKKSRSKGYLLLLLVPWALLVIGTVFVLRGIQAGGFMESVWAYMNDRTLNSDLLFTFLIFSLWGITGIAGFIWLLCLKNKTMDYGVDLAGGEETTHWSDTPTYSAVDDRQYKELDYTPAKNVMDMVGSGDVKDVKDVGDVSAAGAAGEEAPVPEKVMERSVSTERLKMPILLDDAGAAIHCFYHPGADAVNLCSRCKQYVCSECNYVTGTHPICRNCWEKRAEVPIAPSAQKRVSPLSVKPKKQEVVETTEPAQQKDLEPMKPEKQKIAAPGKAEKPEAKKNEWLPEFMTLYEQAAPIINVVVRKSADGMPASPLDLMEGLKLRPMLERAKKLSKPKDKELREAKNEFEQVLSSCVKIADAAANFVSGGGQALLGGPDFTRIVHGIETANGLMEKLSQRLASFPHPQE